MSRPSLVIVLAEDKLQGQFIYRYLKRAGVRSYIRLILSPSGRGSAEHWVRKSFVVQVQKCRSRHAKTGLFVMLDADRESVAKHFAELDNALAAQSQPKVDPVHDAIARLIPKWSIETWILYLSSEGAIQPPVTEDKPYKKAKSPDGWTKLIPAAANVLFAWTRRGSVAPANLLDPLRSGLQEIPRALPSGHWSAMVETRIKPCQQQVAEKQRREEQRRVYRRNQVIGLVLVAAAICAWWLFHANPKWIFPPGWWRP